MAPARPVYAGRAAFVTGSVSCVVSAWLGFVLAQIVVCSQQPDDFDTVAAIGWVYYTAVLWVVQVVSIRNVWEDPLGVWPLFWLSTLEVAGMLWGSIVLSTHMQYVSMWGLQSCLFSAFVLRWADAAKTLNNPEFQAIDVDI